MTFNISFLDALSLIDEVVGFLDLGAEDIVLHEILLDLVDWELDEHTGDLWSSVWCDELLDEWEDHLTDLFLEVLVSLGTGWEQFGGKLLVLGNNGVHWWLLTLHWHALWNTWWAWHWGLSHWHWWASHWRSWHWLSKGLTAHWLVWWNTLSHLSARSVVVEVSSVATLVSATTHTSLAVSDSSGHGLVLLHDVKELLENLGDVWVGGQVVEVDGASLGGLVLLEIGLVDLVLNLDFSEFLDLVVVDDESLVAIGGVAEGLLGIGGVIWLLEADEGEVARTVSIVSLLELDLLDWSEVLEEAVELSLSPGRWEVLDVEVASLLGGLVSEGLLLLLSLSLGFLESMSDIELENVAIGIGTHLSALKALESLLGASWSVLDVLALWVIVADETVLADIVLAEAEGLDVSVLREQLSDVVISHGGWDVFDIDVVDELSHVSSVLWLELDGNTLGASTGGGDGLVGSLVALEADESIASGGVVLIHGDLQRLDVAILLEGVVELLVSNSLGDGSDENVLLGELLSVGTEELSIELEASALLAVNLEVLHLVAGFLELGIVWNGDDGSPEWAGDVLSDLWSALEVNSGFGLELHGDLLGINGVLGEVVKVDKVLFVSVLHHFVDFSFCME